MYVQPHFTLRTLVPHLVMLVLCGVPVPSAISSTAASPLLTVSRLSVTFSGVHALSDLSLEVPDGTILALIGPNGAGKTTLLNVVSGFVRPQSGFVRYGDIDLTRLPAWGRARLGIGRTFQNLQVFGSLSLLDNVIIGRHSRSRTGLIGAMVRWGRAATEDARSREAAMAILGRLGIERYAERRVSELPFGVQKMAGLARALALEPRLVLLDEPAAGMSRLEVDRFAMLMRRIQEEWHLTVVLVEHNMGLVMRLADHVVVVDRGRRLAGGLPEEMRRDPAVLATYLGERTREGETDGRAGAVAGADEP